MNSLPNASASTTCIQGIFIVGALDPHPSLVLQLSEIIMPPPPLEGFSIKDKFMLTKIKSILPVYEFA